MLMLLLKDTLCAGITNAVEKRGVLTGAVERQLHIVKSLRRNGTLQAFKYF